MAFRSTAFDPVNRQVLSQNDPSIDFNDMELKLAQEMSKMKIVDERKKREIEKICKESDELKELQAKITAAYLNKERTAQIAENQFRSQQQLVSIFEVLNPDGPLTFFFVLAGARRQHRHRVPAPEGEGGPGRPLGRLREAAAAVRPEARHPAANDPPRGPAGRGHAGVLAGTRQRGRHYQ